MDNKAVVWKQVLWDEKQTAPSQENPKPRQQESQCETATEQ
jgi:hypothetical protein